MNIPFSDRFISVLTYYTFGIFGLVWIIFCAIVKKPMSKFLLFNLYQSIFISIVLAIISLIYGIAINFLSVIPILGKLAVGFDLFFNQAPIYHTFTLSGGIITILISYLAILALLGKKSYIPGISDIVVDNFGG